jgi:hypothetical protein
MYNFPAVGVFVSTGTVHEFLRSQIAEHQTGDSAEVTKVP